MTPDLSSTPSPSGNPTTSPKECHYLPPVTDHHPELTGKVVQLNVCNNVGPRPPPTSTSTAACDRKPSTANPVNTSEAKSCGSPRQYTLEEHLGLIHIHGNGDPLTSDPEHHMTSTTHVQDSPQNKQQNICGFEITTTAPTPQEPPPNQPTAPLGNVNKTTAKGDKSQIGCSGVTESETTEPGSNFLSYDQTNRHPSLHSSSSVESNASSTCDSAEIEPVQASEENSGEGQPLVNGGIKPGGCSDNRASRQNRQRCKHCSRLRKESTALKEELNKVQRTLSIEREQSNKQVNDLKEQIYIAQQNQTGLVHHIHDIEQRHRYAERTIQKLQRELQLIQAEKFHLKQAYDVCSEKCDMMKAELERADSLQCPDYEDYYAASSNQNPTAMPHTAEQTHSYRPHTDPRGDVQHMYDSQMYRNQQIAGHTMYIPVHPHTL